MKNLLRIGQVSNLYGISLDTLRYYDHKDLLKPIVKENGYRYYSLEHLDVLEMLLVGKYLEIPLEQMKEKMAGESVEGYLDMLLEQRRMIEERRSQLEKLSLYTKEMTSLLSRIHNFENDYTFANVTTKNLDVTIYQMDLNNLFHHENNAIIKGIEAFEQWFVYSVDQEGKIKENNHRVGLSILNHMDSSNKISHSLDCIAEEGNASKCSLSGTYKHISFWGKERDLQEYLNLMCRHFKLKEMTIPIKFPFALLHKDMEHEYFAEIYFTE